MNKFLDSVHKAVSEFNMLKRGDCVIVALSGGADSVSLLYTLKNMSNELGLKLYAAHLNHNLRGAEAKRDEEFCKILCKNYGVELFCESVDIRTLAEKEKSARSCAAGKRDTDSLTLFQKNTTPKSLLRTPLPTMPRRLSLT